jgi:hypothetical protein
MLLTIPEVWWGNGELVVKTRYQYIHFEVKRELTKIKIWSCRNNSTRSELGEVKWYAPWKQYCFYHRVGIPSVFSADCLRDVADFIERLNLSH